MSLLRIIGGRFKSRLIKTPKSTVTRPTSSLVRKAFFDICRNEVIECHFLDLYAGSGAMGIEALSRGAAQSTFVETNRQALHCIKENLKLLEIEKEAVILMKEALAALKSFKKAGTSFDLIYIDPPYHLDPLPILQCLDDFSVSERGMTIFLEEKAPSKVKTKKELFQHLHWVQERKFGTTVLNQFDLIPNK